MINIALSVILSLGGGGLLDFALSSWLGKVWANRILESDRRRFNEELERLRGELNKAIHVHRVQFETEFKVISEIWEKVARVRQTMGGIRPTMDLVDPNEDRRARLERRFKPFPMALDELIRTVDLHSPFYPQNLFTELSGAIQIARREETDVLTSKLDERDWFDRGRSNFDEFVKRADVISALIRERLSTLRVS
ncbi:MAG: hypothetical protein P0111_00715 [Nitrospira sp.]|nr:hypothetical protein [Nitrospira sp.]